MRHIVEVTYNHVFRYGGYIVLNIKAVPPIETLFISTKVQDPNSVTCLIHTLMFEWCVVNFVSKNGHQKDTCP